MISAHDTRHQIRIDAGCMRQWQIGDNPSWSIIECQQKVGGFLGPGQIVMGEHDPLGHPRGATRVHNGGATASPHSVHPGLDLRRLHFLPQLQELLPWHNAAAVPPTNIPVPIDHNHGDGIGLQEGYVLPSILHVLSHNKPALTVFGNVCADFGAVCGVDPRGNTSGKQGTHKGKQPLWGVAAYDVDATELRQPHGQQTGSETHTAIVVLSVVDCMLHIGTLYPLALTLGGKGRTLLVLAGCSPELVDEGGGPHSTHSAALHPHGQLHPIIISPSDVLQGVSGVHGPAHQLLEAQGRHMVAVPSWINPIVYHILVISYHTILS